MTRTIAFVTVCFLAGCSGGERDIWASAEADSGASGSAATGGSTASSGGAGGSAGSETGGAQTGGNAATDGSTTGTGGSSAGTTGVDSGIGGATTVNSDAGCPSGTRYCSDTTRGWWCAPQNPSWGCDTTSCDPCPAPPANASEICSASGTCDFACDPGYFKSPDGTQCWAPCPAGSGQSNCGPNGACVNIFPPCYCCIGLNTCGTLQPDGSCK